MAVWRRWEGGVKGVILFFILISSIPQWEEGSRAECRHGYLRALGRLGAPRLAESLAWRVRLRASGSLPDEPVCKRRGGAANAAAGLEVAMGGVVPAAL